MKKRNAAGLHSDLIYEQYSMAREPMPASEESEEQLTELPGVCCNEQTENGIRTVTLRITDERGETQLGRPRGNYITVFTGPAWKLQSEERAAAVQALSDALRTLAGDLREQKETSGCLFVAGLGNRSITSDSLGPRCTDALLVTHHLRNQTELFSSLGRADLAALAPGVSGQTGIETAELLRAAGECIHPRLILAVDALAARSTERLDSTVQLCDTGIAPGSGIGNHRASIDQKTLGVPVIAIGVPTMVNSSTLVRDAWERAGMEALPDSLENVLESGPQFFVSRRESDAAIPAMASLIAEAIEDCFSPAQSQGEETQAYARYDPPQTGL